MAVKQVIAYRRDLKMRKGKIAAQVAHASLRAFLGRTAPMGDVLAVRLSQDALAWWTRGSAKIVVSVDDEAALLEIARLAQEAGLPFSLITDAGKTEFGGVPTRTTVAVGPADASLIDPITGKEGAVATKLA